MSLVNRDEFRAETQTNNGDIDSTLTHGLTNASIAAEPEYNPGALHGNGGCAT